MSLAHEFSSSFDSTKNNPNQLKQQTINIAIFKEKLYSNVGKFSFNLKIN